MSDGEFAGLGIVALIAVMFLIFLSMFVHPAPQESVVSQQEYAVEDAKDGCLKGALALAVLGLIAFLLFNF